MQEKKQGFLGEEIVSEKLIVVPCYRGKLTDDQQMGIFGKYNLKAFKLHLQGIYEDVDKVTYAGVTRSVSGVIYHRNSTVLVIQ